jgi:zinc protease
MGYKATALGQDVQEWEPYALVMLASVLDGGSSARFSRQMVRGSKVAKSASAGYSAFTRLPGMFLIDGTPAKGRSVDELERAFGEQVERVRNEPVAASELERIRTQLIAGKVYELDSVYSQAMLIGRLETVGLGWPLAYDYVEHLSRVTPEQVQAVARKYLVPEGLTIALLEPQPMDGRQPRPSAAGAHVGAH